MPQLTAPPSDPAPAPPVRRPGSVRRTSTVLMFWPDGLGTDLHLKGRARDLLTPGEGEPIVLSHADLYTVTGRERDIQRIEADPDRPGLQGLVGSRAGGGLRSSIAHELPDEVAGGTPLYLLLDDLAGSTLISGFAFIRWADHVPRDQAASRQRTATHHARHVLRLSRRSQLAVERRLHVGAAPEHRSYRPLGRPGGPARVARAGRPSRDRHASGATDRRVGRRRRPRNRRHVPRQLLGPRRLRGRHPRVPDARPGGPGHWEAPLRHRPPTGAAIRSSAPEPLPTRRGWPAPTCGPCAPRSCSDSGPPIAAPT